MGKFRKMLAGVLSAAMVLSTMTVTAFAADTNKMPTINDTTKTGSITIHKYEYNKNSENHATGEEDRTQLPEGATPLQGAGFTIYKVAGVNDLTKYYNANPESLPSVDEYLIDGKINDSKVLEEIPEAKTDKDGIAKFNNLALGFYVVVETTTPDKVTTPVEPFIVSVPMTTKDGDNWLYDVHVYPKNKTTYGGVTLEKKGNNTEPLSGVKFVLQKWNATESTWENAKNETGVEGVEFGELTTDDNGKITVDGLSQGKYRFIEINRGDNNSGYIMDGATTYVFTVTKDGMIKVGNADPVANATINVNNEKPDMTKEVQDRATKAWKHDTDYNVGDMVPYKITIDVPSNITKLQEFTLTDTPKNLEDNLNLVEVKCGDVTLEKDTNYTIGPDTANGEGFKITFKTSTMEAYAGKKIVVTYNAKLLDSADTTTVENPNTAKLEYSNEILPGQNDIDNPNKPESADTTPGKDSIEDNAVVYTFKLQILKKAEKADGAPLQDVEFDLYKEVSAGTKNAITGDDAKNVGLSSDKHWLKINTGSLKTDGNGEVSQSGLAHGTYYLVETKTVRGYNLLKAPVEVKLDFVYTTTTKKEYVTEENGVKTLVKNEIEKTTFTENGAKSTGIHTETIINKKGFELPITGGMGTVLFSIAGFALMAGAAFVLLKGRRKDA